MINKNTINYSDYFKEIEWKDVTPADRPDTEGSTLCYKIQCLICSEILEIFTGGRINYITDFNNYLLSHLTTHLNELKTRNGKT